MDIPPGTTVWLGQRNNVHGFFKVCLQLCVIYIPAVPFFFLFSFSSGIVIKPAPVKMLTLMNFY